LLFAAGYELLIGRAGPPVFEKEGDSALREFAEAHSNDHFVESLEFREVITRDADRCQAKTMREFGDNIRGVVAQKHFTRSPLPAQMIHIIDISDEIRFLEAYDVAVFVCAGH